MPGGSISTQTEHVHNFGRLSNFRMTIFTTQSKDTGDASPSPLNFAFPFKKADGKDFSDEHEFHSLLARENTGHFPVNDSGMWHGGIHVAAGGAGTSLDLKHGVRCLADGEVVAYRIDRVCPISTVPALAEKPAFTAPYSTSFALVRHAMEYPRGNELTFFSLYMHLQSFEEYQSESSLARPTYWSKAWEVTSAANDKPKSDVHHGYPSGGQVGLNIHDAPKSPSMLGILPRGARVLIGERQGSWGRIAVIESGGPVIPAKIGCLPGANAPTGWICRDNGQAPVGARGDVEVAVRPSRGAGKARQDQRGRSDRSSGSIRPLSPRTSGRRLLHMEVICDGTIRSYLEKSRAWVNQHAAKIEPTMLRTDRQTKLYNAQRSEGADPPLTGVIQIYPFSTLEQGPKENRYDETIPGPDGLKLRWWKIDSADLRHAPITGWVREQNHLGGCVTREAPGSWVDSARTKKRTIRCTRCSRHPRVTKTIGSTRTSRRYRRWRSSVHSRNSSTRRCFRQAWVITPPTSCARRGETRGCNCGWRG
jgi:hypothetical protein